MEKQLTLTGHQLGKIGFVPRVRFKQSDEDNPNSIPREVTYWEIDVINGYFSCDPAQEIYRWYFVCEIGNNSNHIHLDIRKLPELYSILQCFQIKINLILL